MSGQNRSTAVMQRRVEPHDSLEDFPTPMWATRALCEWLIARGLMLDDLVVREPCANRGYMAHPLGEYFQSVEASDICDYGVGYPQADYLFGSAPDLVDFTAINPPFRLAEEFINRACETSRLGVAVFCRSAFLEGEKRYRSLFTANPPSAILQFAERVVLHKAAMRQKGSKYWDPSHDNGAGQPKGKTKTASSATSYCWLIFEPDYAGDHPEFHWVAPCRESLEREGDYDWRGHVD